MKTKSLGALREPYVRGPHLRYFLLATSIAFIVATITLIGFALFVQLFTR